MNSTEASLGQALPAEARRGGVALTAAAFDDWTSVEARWERLTAHADALPFQRTAWLRAWYRHCAGPDITPLIVILQEALTGTDVLGLGLVRLREGGRHVIAFADCGLTDYNAPALGRRFPDGLDPNELWAALRQALPRADLLRFEKMPLTVDSRANPLATLPGASPSKFIGNILHVPGTWDEWHWGLERTFRKELERSARVFEKHPGATFRRYAAGHEAERVYAELERLQRERIAELGLPYALDAEPARSFYRAIVTEGLRDGTAILTALTIGDEVVAALLGLTDGTHYAMTRLATPGPQWKNFSPGRMVIERTMKMLHAEGFRAFDFTIGDYSYKRRIGVTPLAMCELHQALSMRGWASATSTRWRAWARQNDRLRRLVQSVRGTKPETVSH
ncbi:GNAT family N-acetyltransferase [Lichenifustis flavocetrariae]|uniref:GNAT family N-acetyltransferase n=1 Tax=Lichenifustis flavocetrariae TaxID=2949735 RepID=A0AA42CMP9_9HYPH|nr:GNAT family N-acetyltransferase [Lichenifustis flavocetrariae]MCW6508612.1 GNAT family N-acetyltransferase [Lichenifustis flavocetrariae]